MQLKIINKITLAVFTVLAFFFIQGCGGSAPEVQQNANTSGENKKQNEKMSDIEQLLGIESKEAQEKNKPKEGNDDLLTLLGAEDKPKEVHSSSKKNEDVVPVKKQQEIDSKPQDEAKKQPVEKKKEAQPEMNKQLQEKEAEIEQLKGELQDKELTIARLESSPPSTATPIVVGDISDEEYPNLYEQGLSLFNNRNYKEAITVFERLIASNDQNKLSDNAQYWIGESHYMLGKYKEAVLDFEKVFSYTNANKKDHAQFKLGKCYSRLGDKKRAKEEFQRFLSLYPKSDLRGKAEKALSEL